MTDVDKFVLNAKEATAFLSISKGTLHRLIADKQLRKVQISSRRVGWLHSELIRFIFDKQNG